MSDLIGRTLSGRYEILSLLGEGGMAQVYQARHLQLDRLVAVKVMMSHLTRDPTFAQRFEREARLIAQLHHPHIIQVYDFDTLPDEQLYFMVIELLTGPSLAHILDAHIRENRLFSLAETLRVVRDVASALDYAHKRGMIHRDIKPGNVMLDDKRVVLTDFGLARVFDSTASPSLTASGMVVGTPAYMSPEQVMGMSGDARSDLYSLGIMFYQMVVNQLPFKADTPLAMALQHVNSVPRRPIDLNSSVPPAVEKVILRLLDKDPDLRYPSAEALIADLDRVENVKPLDVTTDGLEIGPETVVLPSTQTGVKTATAQANPSPVPQSNALKFALTGIALVIVVILALTVGRSLFSAGGGSATPSTIIALAASSTVTATNTNAATSTLTYTPSPTLTLSYTPSLTPTFTLSPTLTYTVAPTLTNTSVPTLTPTIKTVAAPCTVSLINALPITLRSGPGTEFALTPDQMAPGEALAVTGDARDPNTQEAWWRVEDATRRGWVPFNEVNTSGVCTLVPIIAFAQPTETETAVVVEMPTSFTIGITPSVDGSRNGGIILSPTQSNLSLGPVITTPTPSGSSLGIAFATDALPYNFSTAVATSTDIPTAVPPTANSIPFATDALPYQASSDSSTGVPSGPTPTPVVPTDVSGGSNAVY